MAWWSVEAVSAVAAVVVVWWLTRAAWSRRVAAQRDVSYRAGFADGRCSVGGAQPGNGLGGQVPGCASARRRPSRSVSHFQRPPNQSP